MLLGQAVVAVAVVRLPVRQHYVKAAAAVAPRFRKSLAQQLRQLPKRAEKSRKGKQTANTAQRAEETLPKTGKVSSFWLPPVADFSTPTHTARGAREARRGEGGGVGGKATTWPGIKITFPRTVKYYEFLHFRNSFLSAFPSSVTPQ